MGMGNLCLDNVTGLGLPPRAVVPPRIKGEGHSHLQRQKLLLTHIKKLKI